jgi:hypothetical protein
MKPWTIAALAVVVASTSWQCRRSSTKTVVADAAATPVLTSQQVSALLAECEGHARKGNAQGFRGCLTAASAKALDSAFARNRAAVKAGLEGIAPLERRLNRLVPRRKKKLAAEIDKLAAARARLAALEQRASWPTQLQLIGRAPKCQVEQVKPSPGGDRASFYKRVGAQRTQHHLAREGGRWRIDLNANPALGQRLDGLGQQIALAAKALQAAATELEQALAGKKRRAPKRPKPKTTGKAAKTK